MESSERMKIEMEMRIQCRRMRWSQGVDIAKGLRLDLQEKPFAKALLALFGLPAVAERAVKWLKVQSH